MYHVTSMAGEKHVPNEPVWETWDSVLLKTMSVGAEMQADIHAGIIPAFDAIAGIPRGGLFVVNVWARQLGLSGDKVLSLGMSRFERDHPTRPGEMKIGQMPREEDVYGKVIMLADEVYDTCKTAKAGSEHLYSMGAEMVIMAGVHYKPGQNETDIKPDYYAMETDGWVHYPWEVIDPIGTLHQKIAATK